MSSMNALDVYRKALRELSARHTHELPRKLSEIEQEWDRALAAGGERNIVSGLQRMAHGFDAASSVLGLPQLAAPARRLAASLASLLAYNEPLIPTNIHRIEALIAELRTAARTAAGWQGDPPVDHGSTAPPGTPDLPREVREAMPPSVAPPAPSDTTPPRMLYVLEKDAHVAKMLATQLAPFGYSIETRDTSEALVEALVGAAPYAVILDPDTPGVGLATARAIASPRGSISSRAPVIFVSDRGDIDARLESVRAGAVAYFPKPLRVTDLVDKLDALSQREFPEPYRVMIVDGEAARADLCRAVLHEVGMEVSLVLDPMQLVTMLGDFNPELLLIALKLPECGGDEIAQVVHQIPSYVSMPVVFLSEHWNLDRQIGLMNVGGDALLPLPLQASQLIATVIARVERYRTLSALMQHDSLTGLLNHSRLHQYVEIESLRALRQNHPLSFAMIDIDHFKSVNDQFGHPVGDRVLKNLARFLRQNLRKSDIVGRYGGEEFAVVLTDTDGPDALAVLAKLCSDFGMVEHDAEGARISVSFSAGVATMSAVPSARELVLAADRALYEAKRRGRNQAVLWGDQEPPKVLPALVSGG
jgi:diguanylate cyclase (GGDEF)-like protein